MSTTAKFAHPVHPDRSGVVHRACGDEMLYSLYGEGGGGGGVRRDGYQSPRLGSCVGSSGSVAHLVCRRFRLTQAWRGS